jgi:hypothetical protein
MDANPEFMEAVTRARRRFIFRDDPRPVVRGPMVPPLAVRQNLNPASTC